MFVMLFRCPPCSGKIHLSRGTCARVCACQHATKCQSKGPVEDTHRAFSHRWLASFLLLEHPAVDGLFKDARPHHLVRHILVPSGMGQQLLERLHVK